MEEGMFTNMILDKQETEQLAEFMKRVQEFLIATKKERTNVGMKMWDEAHEWLIKIGK